MAEEKARSAQYEYRAVSAGANYLRHAIICT